MPVRRIDHLNLMTADTVAVRDFMMEALGFCERERVEVDGGGPVIASWLSVTNLTHDIALIPEPTPARGRFHHVCFHYHCGCSTSSTSPRSPARPGSRSNTAPAGTASAARRSST